MKQSLKWIFLSSVLALSLAGPVAARQGDGPGARPTPPPPRDRECTHGCRETYRQCVGTGREAFGICAEATCSEQRAAVTAACGDGSGEHGRMQASEACQQARAAARECLAPCFTEFRATLDTCRADGKTCGEACPVATPRPTPAPKDPTCVSACRTSLNTCLSDARTTLIACNEQCADEVQAARTACTSGRSEACRAARQAAGECLEPCGKGLRDASRSCLDAAHTCAEACTIAQ
jgi:hypothetical protein